MYLDLRLDLPNYAMLCMCLQEKIHVLVPSCELTAEQQSLLDWLSWHAPSNHEIIYVV